MKYFLDNVASRGYIIVNKVKIMTAKSIGVRKLKDNLSGYLKEVEAGTVILVSDRDRIIAEIHEPAPGLYKSDNPLLASWVREGRVHAPRTEKTVCPESPVKIAGMNSLKLLNEERGE
jgi:hypothetical protein